MAASYVPLGREPAVSSSSFEFDDDDDDDDEFYGATRPPRSLLQRASLASFASVGARGHWLTLLRAVG